MSPSGPVTVLGRRRMLVDKTGKDSGPRGPCRCCRGSSPHRTPGTATGRQRPEAVRGERTGMARGTGRNRSGQRGLIEKVTVRDALEEGTDGQPCGQPGSQEHLSGPKPSFTGTREAPLFLALPPVTEASLK